MTDSVYCEDDKITPKNNNRCIGVCKRSAEVGYYAVCGVTIIIGFFGWTGLVVVSLPLTWVSSYLEYIITGDIINTESYWIKMLNPEIFIYNNVFRKKGEQKREYVDFVSKRNNIQRCKLFKQS